MRNIMLVVLAAVLLVACGGGGAGGGGGDDDGQLGLGDRGLDRCSLISAEEAEQWLGASLTAEPAEGLDGEPSLVTCSYTSDEGPDSFLIQVYDGEVFHSEEGSDARTGETIDGLGEDAWVQEGDINFLQNDWTVSVSRIIGLRPTNEELLDIAVLVSSRLP